jgi:hypothetical protein
MFIFIFFILCIISQNGSMDERGGAGGFARLAAAAMCDHAVL